MKARSERGAAAVEFALMIPALVLLFAVVVGGARVWFARTTLDNISGSAARAASLARSASEAVHDANRVARMQATTEGLRCEPLDLDVDVSGFRVPVGTPAAVTARVRCTVELSDLIIPGWPGGLRLESESRSVLDRYRGRG
ncbi:MAG: TadE family protein [Micropruina sp.]|nr:pilus assembly protein [Micropruina sp.]